MKGEEMTGRVGRMDGMGDLAEFLLARIAEDEAVARAATAGSWEVRPYWFTSNGRSWATVPDVINEDIDAKDAEHIARWDPARVLAECEAKRRIVTEHRSETSQMTWITESGIGPGGMATACRTCHVDNCPTLRALALPYADHPDFREEWKP